MIPGRNPDRAAIRRRFDREAERYDARWSAYVRRSVEQTLTRLELVGSERILDVGCGTGALFEAIRERHPDARLTGLDVSEGMLAAARRKLGNRVSFAAGEADRLPFRDHSFDLVVSTSTLHYWRRPADCLREAYRVLEPSGRIVVTDWCADFLACRLFDLCLRLFDPAHERVYRVDELLQFLKVGGFARTRAERYRLDRLWKLMTARGDR